MNTIKLTSTVKKGGCAAKLPAAELKKVLGDIKPKGRKELLVGTETLDDAALWDLGNGQIMIKTLDFFTPIVDDPWEFGAVAATNSISDIYAMGGEPAIALGILAYPTATLPMELLKPLMEGALAKIEEAGACLAGGHSIDDETLKFGLSVTGFVAKEKAWVNSGAKVGDSLILTKPLGTGTIVSAHKEGEAKPEWLQAAIASMMTLNKVPELLKDIPVNAATDITGFGLAGHCMQMALASHVSMEFDINSLPLLEGAVSCLESGNLNRAHKTNSDYTKAYSEYENVSEVMRLITVDAQTSGGLLLSIPQSFVQVAFDRIKSKFPLAKIIGKVTERKVQEHRLLIFK